MQLLPGPTIPGVVGVVDLRKLVVVFVTQRIDYVDHCIARLAGDDCWREGRLVPGRFRAAGQGRVTVRDRTNATTGDFPEITGNVGIGCGPVGFRVSE